MNHPAAVRCLTVQPTEPEKEVACPSLEQPPSTILPAYPCRGGCGEHKWYVLPALHYARLTLFIPMYLTSVKIFYSQYDRQGHENPKTIDCEIWYGTDLFVRNLLTRYSHVAVKPLAFAIGFATGYLKAVRKQVHEHGIHDHPWTR